MDIKVTIDGKTYGATDVNSLKYDSGAYSGDTFAIGSTYSNTVQIEFSHLIEGLKLGMEVHPSIGIKTSSGYVYEPLGVFIISSEIKMDRNNNLTTVSASDRFCGLEGTYVSKLTYPAKVLDVIAEICAQSGVKANTDDLARLLHQADLPAPITGQSYRKALGWIAQLYVGYALFDRQGLFTIRTISEPNYELDPSQYEQAGLTKNEAAYKINGIQCQVTLTTKTRDGESTEETKTYQAGDTTGSQIKLENNIMTPKRLNDIWEQLKDLTFYPFSLNWFGNPAVEAGDWLRLEDKQGNSFVVPNSSYTLDFNGGLSATSKADQTTSSDQMVPWQGSVAQTIKELQLRRLPDGTVVFPPSVTEPPTNAKFNDVWFRKNGNATELWVFEKQDDGTGKWVRKDLSDGEIRKMVEQAQSDLNQAKADIITNKQKADTDIENLNKSIEDNKKTADDSLQKLSNSITKLQGQYDNNIVPDLTKVTNDVSDALQKYISAQNSIADLTKQAQQQGKNIADVTKTVDGLNINYANLLGDVNSTKVDVKGIQTTLGNASGDIVQLKATTQNLQTLLAGKVDNSTYTNFVNLTNQALQAKLTASDLNGYAKTADLQATANGLKLNIDSVTDRMNNLKIGGRNLIPNSETDIVVESKTTDPYPEWDNKIIFNNLKNNTTYTFSVSATNTNNVQQASVRIYCDNYNGKYVNKEVKAWFCNADSKRHSFTFTTPDDGIPYQVRLYAGPMGTAQGKNFATTYHHPQLELGTIASDYRPAPEDTEHSLSELSARITATSQQFSSYYTKSETDNKTNSAKNDAINSIKNDGNWHGLSNILTNSGFLQNADGFLQKVQQTTIPMFSGGGINLVRGTSNSWSASWTNLNGGENQTKDIGKFYLNGLNAGDWVTLHINYQYQDLTGTNPQILVQANGNKTGWNYDVLPGRNWQKLQTTSGWHGGHFEWSFQINNDALKNDYLNLQFRIDRAKGGYIQWVNLKVEKGKVATSWSPAPNDLATQSAFSELSQSLEGLRSTVGSNYGNLQSQISQSSSAVRTDLINKITGVQNQFTSTADGLNAKIGAIQIGGRNYLRNSNKSITGWGQDLGTIGNETLNALAGKTITVSVDVEWSNFKSDSSKQNRLGFELSAKGSDGHDYWLGAWKNPTTSKGRERVSTQYALPAGVTFTVINNSHSGYVSINGSGKASHAKIEIGSKMTDWSPAPEDTEQAFNEVNATINGLKSTVSGNYGQLQNTITQTNQTTRNEITDKVNKLQSQMTLQANNFNVNLQKATAGGGVNLAYGTNNVSFSGTSGQDGYIGGLTVEKVNELRGQTITISVDVEWNGWRTSNSQPNNRIGWEMQLNYKDGSSSDYPGVWLRPTTVNGKQRIYATSTIPNKEIKSIGENRGYIQIECNNAKISNLKIEKGTIATPYTANPYDIYMNPNVTTKTYTSAQDINNLRTEGNYIIRAMNNPNSPIGNWLVVNVKGTGDRLRQTLSADNDPNLSYTRTYNGSWSGWQRTVTAGNIMAQINMSAGTTLIQNDKIYMDASSTVFSGNAFIPSAAITSLNADKITTGTLNAANVNIINLNANNITAGTLRGSNGEFYLDSGSLHVWQDNHNAWIDQNGIHDYDNSGNNVWIKKGGVSAYGNDSSVDIRDGEIHLNKKMGLTDRVLSADYGSITKADNVLGFGTNGLSLTGTDGFLLKTNGWENGVLSRMAGNPIVGSGISGDKRGFMQLAANKQLFLYAGSPVSTGKINTLPHLLLDGAYNNNGETQLYGSFSSYCFTSPNGTLAGGLSIENNSVMLRSLNGENGFFADSNSATLTAGDKYISVGGIWPGVKGDFNVSGNLSVSGSKNAIVPTSRGMAAINAYETAEYYFGDIGEAQTNSDGIITVMIDPFFLETVNTVVPYQVFLTSYGDANVWITSRSANCFVVKSSKPNIHFAWEIKAKRKGYENDRMEIVKGVNQNE
nr:peptidase [Limosilactobacillus rudii]